MSTPKWWVYRGTGQPHRWKLPAPPPWRAFTGQAPKAPATDESDLPVWSEVDPGQLKRRKLLATTFRPESAVVSQVNAAIILRRPLLITGPPGTGKSTLAHSIAHELDLGEALTWPISSRSTLAEGLYRYDAIGRLQEVALLERSGAPIPGAGQIGRFLSLGPLGTALLPSSRPRVLLIDELDKGDVDLPNDLLSVLEYGVFTIPELRRLTQPVVTVLSDDGRPARIERGRVECAEFPIVIITSNGERQFPAAFVRRCTRVDIQQPSHDRLREIVRLHFGEDIAARPEVQHLVNQFGQKLRGHDAVFATDQLLNAVHFSGSVGSSADESVRDVIVQLLRKLDDRA